MSHPLAQAQAPHSSHPTGTCTEQYVLSSGVPGHDAHALGMALQGDNRLPQWQCQAPIRDLPHLQRRGKGVWGGTQQSSPKASLAQVPKLTMTVQSSEPLAMTLSLCGHQAMSSTGAVWPQTVGTFLSTRPV